MKPIINAIKHYVQLENASIASGARRSFQFVTAVDQNTAGTSTDQVLEGSIIKAVFVEVWMKSNSTAGTDNKFQVCVEKVPAGQASITFTQMNNMMAYPNKKNVFHFGQGVLGDLTTQSMPVLRQWFKIPKGKQRFGLDDVFVASMSATGAAFDSCGFSTYKEYK